MIGRSARVSTSLGTMVVAALLPKCPLCVAAMLSGVGLSAAVAGSLAPFVRPLGVAFVVAALLAAAWGERQRWLGRRERSRGGCCESRR